MRFFLKYGEKEKNEKDVLLLASIEYQSGIKKLRGQLLNICEIRKKFFHFLLLSRSLTGWTGAAARTRPNTRPAAVPAPAEARKIVSSSYVSVPFR